MPVSAHWQVESLPEGGRIDDRQLHTRMASVVGGQARAEEASSWNEEDWSFDFILATDEPVMMWTEFGRMPEILLVGGAEFEATHPLLDSHARYSVDNAKGRIENLARGDGQLTAKGYVSKAEPAVAQKIRDRTVTDISVGYQVLAYKYIPEGETYTHRGRALKGPVAIAEKWRVKEGSITPIGADPNCKIRSEPEEKAMDKELLALLRARGLPEATTSTNEVKTWLALKGMPGSIPDNGIRAWVENNGALFENSNSARTVQASATAVVQPPAAAAPAPTPQPQPVQMQELRTALAAPLDLAAYQESVRAQVAAEVQRSVQAAASAMAQETIRAIREQEERVDAIRKECNLIGRADLFESLRNLTLNEAKAKIWDSLRAEPVPFASLQSRTSIIAGPAQIEKHQDAIRTALFDSLTRNGKEALRERAFPAAQRTNSDLQGRSLFQLLVSHLESEGVSRNELDRMNRTDIVLTAFGRGESSGIRLQSRAMNTIGSFANLMLDALNKSMLVSYTEVPTTYQRVFRQAEPANDFKSINRVAMSETPNLEAWTMNRPLDQFALSDEREFYQVEAFGNATSINFKCFVNDDMDALRSMMVSMANAAARSMNAFMWSIVTSNPTLSADSVALFAAATGARKNTNLVASGGAPSIAQLSEMRRLARLMKGRNKADGNAPDAVTNLSLKYIVTPAALEGAIKDVLLSQYAPGANRNTYDVNQFYGEGLEAVIEPLLDSNSTTAWYAFGDANTRLLDHIEYCFLRGYETPRINAIPDPHTWGQTYQCVWFWGGKAVDHRGAIKNPGV